MANGIRTGDPRGFKKKDVLRSSVKVPEFDKHLKKAGGHIGRKVVEITIKMKTIVRKPWMIKINKLRLRNLDNCKLFVLDRNMWDIYIYIYIYIWYDVTLKMVLYTSLLNTQQYKVHIKGKVGQPRERSSTLPYTSV